MKIQEKTKKILIWEISHEFEFEGKQVFLFDQCQLWATPNTTKHQTMVGWKI